MAYSFESIYDTLTEMRTCPYQGVTKNYGYRTLGRSAVYDGGAGYYDWHPDSLEDDDDAIIIKPNNLPVFMPGRWHARPNQDGVLDLSSAGFDTTGQTDQAEKLLKILFLAQRLGITTVELPAGRIDVRSWINLYAQDQYRGLSNLHIRGKGRARTSLSTKVSFEVMLPDVRLIATSALPLCFAAGAGVGKTLTAAANGALSCDGTAVATNDLILVVGELDRRNNGPYIVTAPGSGGTKFVLTRAPGLDTSVALGARVGIRATAGASQTRAVWVLSNKANQYWSTDAMTIDVSEQYWTAEEFVPGAIKFAPLWEVDVYRGTVPTYSAQHFNQWVTAGTSTFTNVSFLTGGAWTDPDTGRSYTLKPITVGTKIFPKLGGTPTDQGWYYDGYKCTVRSVNLTTSTMTVDRLSKLTTINSIGEISLGLVTGTGANSLTVQQPPQADLCQLNDRIIVDGRVGFGVVASKNPLTGQIGVNPATLPAGTTNGDTAYVVEGAPVSLGTVNAVGAGTFTCTTPANAGLLSPNDHIWAAGRSFFGKVTSRNATTGVVTFTTVDGNTPLTGLTNGDTVYQTGHFPSYNDNRARRHVHNDYHRIERDCENIEISDLTLDGVSLWADFVTNLHIHHVDQKNVHIGLNISGTVGHIHDCVISNGNGFNFAGITAPGDPLVWYGWMIQSNYNPDLVIENMHGDGISAHWADQEAETRTRWRNIRVTLNPTTTQHLSQFVGGSTPNVLKHNQVENLIVDGAFINPVILNDPVHNLNWYAINPTVNWPGAAMDLNVITGTLEFKARRYDMGFRRRWEVNIPMTAGMTKTIKRPWKGIWSNTRIYCSMPDMTGFTSFVIAPDLVTQTDVIGIIAGNYAQNAWFYPGTDDMTGSYPNAADNAQQTITITTSGAFPAGTHRIYLVSDCIPEITRGDGYSGVSSGFDAKLYGKYPDNSYPPMQYLAAPPAAAPNFPGEKAIDAATGFIYEAIDVTAAGDWKRTA